MGQDIFEARRLLHVLAPLEQALLDQSIEPASQHVGRDIQILLERIEACCAVEGFAEDQDAPPLSHTLETARDRTLHVPESLSLHSAPGISTVTIKMIAPATPIGPAPLGAGQSGVRSAN